MEEYEIKLRLTETEAEQLVKAAAQHDQKVSELLGSFIYDLVASDEHRGGDDETELAQQWYQRRNEALYPHHVTPLTESESLKLAKTDTQKRCIQEAFRYTPLCFEWINATMIEDGVIMEDQDHELVRFSILEDGDIDFDDDYGNSCNDLKLVRESDKITWDEVEARLRSYSKEHQQELQYHLEECCKRLPRQGGRFDFVQMKMEKNIYHLKATLQQILDSNDRT
ncbi:hypothetical protein MKC73_01265 [[Clostridium] innocuum]|nr:hypothetical protein [[Clostridium] innocuum]